MIRQHQILLMLPRFPKYLTTTQLYKKLTTYQGFTVSLKTVQRDMQNLILSFPNRIGMETYDDFISRMRASKEYIIEPEDKSFHWFWFKDSPITLASLSINQALSLILLKKYLSPLFPKATLNDLNPFFSEAEHYLSTLDENALTKWPNKIAIVHPTQPELPPVIDSNIHLTISEALLTDKQLYIKQILKDKSSQYYTLNPLGLVLRCGLSYLIASKVNTNEICVFSLHSITEASQAEENVIRPADFNLQNFIDEGKIGFSILTEAITK